MERFWHILHVKKDDEILFRFSSLWGGASRRCGSPGSIQILKNQTIVYSARPAPPEGGAANLKASPLPPAPFDGQWTAELVNCRTCRSGRIGKSVRF